MRKGLAAALLSRGQRGRLRILSARELLTVQAEAHALCPDEEGYPLAFAACLAAKSLGRGSGETLLRTLSAEQLEALAARYQEKSRALSPAVGDLRALRALEAELQADPGLRLYWRVLRAFGALPNEPRARALTSGELLFCAANLALDEQEKLDELCPTCRAEAELPRCPVCGAVRAEVNPGFDEERFEALKEETT